MKYRYLYQTKNNENREGEIKASSRADAYAQLRKAGIRPYRLIGDDPFNWRPWAMGVLAAGVVALAGVSGWLLLHVSSSGEEKQETMRRQLAGDDLVIGEGVLDGWSMVFADKFDRYLAAFVQPGREILPPEVTIEERAAFAASLEKPLVCLREDRPEYRQVRDIVRGLRDEMRRKMSEGLTVEQYLKFLEKRQQDEIAYRKRAGDACDRAPDNYRLDVWRGVNARLRERGMAPLPKPVALTAD